MPREPAYGGKRRQDAEAPPPSSERRHGCRSERPATGRGQPRTPTTGPTPLRTVEGVLVVLDDRLLAGEQRDGHDVDAGAAVLETVAADVGCG